MKGQTSKAGGGRHAGRGNKEGVNGQVESNVVGKNRRTVGRTHRHPEGREGRVAGVKCVKLCGTARARQVWWCGREVPGIV